PRQSLDPFSGYLTSPDGFFLSFQQLLLSFQAPAIASQALVFANNSVTRNHQRHRICRAGASDCAYGFSLSNRFCYFAVGIRFAIRDGAQLIPHLPLKSRRPNIKWQVDVWTLVFQMLDYRAERRTKRLLFKPNLCLRKLARQISFE